MHATTGWYPNKRWLQRPLNVNRSHLLRLAKLAAKLAKQLASLPGDLVFLQQITCILNTLVLQTPGWGAGGPHVNSLGI